MIRLSKRLLAVAQMVSKGSVVADVGCDHGYVSIYLVQEKIAPRTIAMDVNQGPLLRAKVHVEKYELSDYIELRLSNGGMQLKEGEADSFLCAGMGGRLMIRLLEESFQKVKQMKEWILQPQSEVEQVRAYIRTHGFEIAKEEMVLDDGKYYVIMKAIPKQEKIVQTLEVGEEQMLADLYGPYLLQENHPVLLEFLQKEEQKYETLMQTIVYAKSQEARHEIQRKQKQVQLAIHYMGGRKNEDEM